MLELLKQAVALSLVSDLQETLNGPTIKIIETVAAVLLGILWLGIGGYFFRKYVLSPSQKRGSSKRRHGHKRGKRCPQCTNLVDSRRKVCQHCGHVFPDSSEAEAKPKPAPKPKSGSSPSRKRGKYCPQCHKMIGYERPACQHCGYVFFEAKTSESSANPSEPSAP